MKNKHTRCGKMKAKGQGKGLGYIWLEKMFIRQSAFYRFFIGDNVRQSQVKIKSTVQI